MAMKYAAHTCKMGSIECRYALHPIAPKSTCGQETSLDDATPANAKSYFQQFASLCHVNPQQAASLYMGNETPTFRQSVGANCLI